MYCRWIYKYAHDCGHSSVVLFPALQTFETMALPPINRQDVRGEEQGSSQDNQESGYQISLKYISVFMWALLLLHVMMSRSLSRNGLKLKKSRQQLLLVGPDCNGQPVLKQCLYHFSYWWHQVFTSCLPLTTKFPMVTYFRLKSSKLTPVPTHVSRWIVSGWNDSEVLLLGGGLG